eukprot:scaffold312_cov52-Cyclotella_meneghiniana.AAC.8
MGVDVSTYPFPHGAHFSRQKSASSLIHCRKPMAAHKIVQGPTPSTAIYSPFCHGREDIGVHGSEC